MDHFACGFLLFYLKPLAQNELHETKSRFDLFVSLFERVAAFSLAWLVLGAHIA